jgi:hypothetical protein
MKRRTSSNANPRLFLVFLAITTVVRIHDGEVVIVALVPLLLLLLLLLRLLLLLLLPLAHGSNRDQVLRRFHCNTATRL